MCTVTLYPINSTDFILTSNRDESPSRRALAPRIYTMGSAEVLLPKDEISGGSWIGASSKKRVLCLLNGGSIPYLRKAAYRKSRGEVVRDFLTADMLLKTIEAYNLSDIEPFTLVIADWNTTLNYYEFIWDGLAKQLILLPPEPRIWSSTTLYTQQQKDLRKDWFEAFKSKTELNAQSLLKFHHTAGNEHPDFGVIMDRGFVKTTSITQVIKNKNKIAMRFENLDSGEMIEKEL
ncbi:NRDE family protein [Bizionia gelidisalsuginis]|uniref:NRDE family protein n=1 Tax=Bizionia gelidisalsuginis TaxID=291188 RepID=A0ABY3MA84_9FLAO|nr:NRDE family protein [Bizionia gelidisalsuginis]TYC12649.1 NRDE family protein [Bizionia gelidisalsuginis]